jgi:uncharacterized membrane protein
MPSAPSTPSRLEGAASPPSPAGAAEAGTTTGLDPRLAGLLAYLAGWVTGLVLLLVEREHREVRFHAAQSLLVSLSLTGAFLALSVLAMVPFVGIVAIPGFVVLGLAGSVTWVYLLVQGYRLRHVRLPSLGEVAEQWAGR